MKRSNHVFTTTEEFAQQLRGRWLGTIAMRSGDVVGSTKIEKLEKVGQVFGYGKYLRWRLEFRGAMN